MRTSARARSSSAPLSADPTRTWLTLQLDSFGAIDPRSSCTSIAPKTTRTVRSEGKRQKNSWGREIFFRAFWRDLPRWSRRSIRRDGLGAIQPTTPVCTIALGHRLSQDGRFHAPSVAEDALCRTRPAFVRGGGPPSGTPLRHRNVPSRFRRTGAKRNSGIARRGAGRTAGRLQMRNLLSVTGLRARVSPGVHRSGRLLRGWFPRVPRGVNHRSLPSRTCGGTFGERARCTAQGGRNDSDHTG